jgi:hypothetical protein
VWIVYICLKNANLEWGEKCIGKLPIGDIPFLPLQQHLLIIVRCSAISIGTNSSRGGGTIAFAIGWHWHTRQMDLWECDGRTTAQMANGTTFTPTAATAF